MIPDATREKVINPEGPANQQTAAQNPPEIFKLELTITRVNTILQALGAAPYAQVVDTINDIQKQCRGQIPGQ